MLKIMFKDRPGQKRIVKNEYEITEESEGTLIGRSDWRSKVLPGTRILMGIVIVVPTSLSIVATGYRAKLSRPATDKCSRCNTLNAITLPTKGLLKWYVSRPIQTAVFYLLPVQEHGRADQHYSTKSRKCDLIFRNIDTERRVEELPEFLLEQDSEVAAKAKNPAAPQTLQRRVKGQRESPRILSEENAFRRIHYRREVLRYPGLKCGDDCQGACE